jgi:hypothetical protein
VVAQSHSCFESALVAQSSAWESALCRAEERSKEFVAAEAMARAIDCWTVELVLTFVDQNRTGQ